MADRSDRFSQAVSPTSVEIPETELKRLSNGALVERLVSGGVSRLTAERFVEIQRGDVHPGRARPHSTSRR
jgi:hypothetical protein